MRLADTERTFTARGHNIRLRSPLRAAIHLLQKHSEPFALLHKLADGNSEAIGNVFAECDRASANDLFKRSQDQHFDAGLINAAPVFVDHVAALYGIDLLAKPDNAAPAGKPVPMAEQLEDLFGLATGIMGWSPEQAYEASPIEITIAAKAYFRFHGIKTDDESTGPTIPVTERDEAGWQSFKAAAQAGGNRAN